MDRTPRARISITTSVPCSAGSRVTLGPFYAELESKELREKVVALQGELKVAKGTLT
jgi:hypothetical protein